MCHDARVDAARGESAGVVPLLDAWPELGGALNPAERTAASRQLVIRTERVPHAGWRPDGGIGDEDVTCMLVVQGLLVREALVGDVRAAELLGVGDVVHVAADADADLLGSAVAWTAIDEVLVGWMDASTFAAMARWPVLGSALLARATERSRRQAVFQAICHHVRVDARIVGLLWQLADRWGRATPAGIVVPLRLTHDAIAALIGAQRPTVSTALGVLAERHVVERRDDGGWLLRPDTDEELARMFARIREARSPDIEIIEELPSPLAGRRKAHMAGIADRWERRSAALMRVRQRSAHLRAQARALQAERHRRDEQTSEHNTRHRDPPAP